MLLNQMFRVNLQIWFGAVTRVDKYRTVIEGVTHFIPPHHPNRVFELAIILGQLLK